jgi:hypothetical protein
MKLEKLSQDDLLKQYEELCEDMQEMEFGSCSYDFASVDLMEVECELKKRGLK